MISNPSQLQTFPILKISPEPNQDIYAVLYSKEKSKKGKIISTKGIEHFFHTLIIEEEEKEFTFLNTAYELNHIQEFKLDFDCSDEAIQKIIYYMYFKELEVDNFDFAISVLQLCYFFKNFKIFQKICKHFIELLINISEEDKLKTYIKRFSKIYLFCKKGESARTDEKNYESCLNEIFLHIFNHFFNEEKPKKSVLNLFDEKYFEGLKEELAEEVLRLFEFFLGSLTKMSITIEEKLEFVSKFLIRHNFKDEQKKKEYIKFIFNSELKLNENVKKNITEYNYLSDLGVFEEDELKNIILNVSFLKSKATEEKIKSFEESIFAYEKSNILLKFELSSLNNTLLESEEIIEKLNTTIKNLEEKLNITSEELSSKKEILNECSNLFVNQQFTPNNLKSFIENAKTNEKEISALKEEIQNKNNLSLTQNNAKNIFGVFSKSSEGSSGFMSHDGPRCLDGSLDMRYAVNRGKNKYYD